MRTMLPVIALSILAGLPGWPTDIRTLLAPDADRARTAARLGDDQTPPGATNPRVLVSVKPTYTAAAMRAKIQGSVVVECVVLRDGTVGDVRVVKSLDPVYGLDQEAVKAAKQWRFVPGMVNNVAVPVAVSIELTFVLDGPGARAAARQPAWPVAFSSASGTRARTEEWTDEVLEDWGIRVRFSYPDGWTFRKETTAGRWFAVQNGLRVLVVSRPRPVPGSGLQAAPSTSQRIEDGARGRPATDYPLVPLQATGRVQTADRAWHWSDGWTPPDDPEFPSDAAAPFNESFGGARMWNFVTTIGSDTISVNCFVIRPRDMSDASMREEEREAGAQFRMMLERMVVERR